MPRSGEASFEQLTELLDAISTAEQGRQTVETQAKEMEATAENLRMASQDIVQATLTEASSYLLRANQLGQLTARQCLEGYLTLDAHQPPIQPILPRVRYHVPRTDGPTKEQYLTAFDKMKPGEPILAGEDLRDSGVIASEAHINLTPGGDYGLGADILFKLKDNSEKARKVKVWVRSLPGFIIGVNDIQTFVDSRRFHSEPDGDNFYHLQNVQEKLGVLATLGISIDSAQLDSEIEDARQHHQLKQRLRRRQSPLFR